MNIGVIGGGVLGLSVAFELSKKGHRVALYERSPFLGGQASTFDIGGGRLERGYHHLFTSDYDMVDLIKELGLGPKLAWIPSKVGFFHGGRAYPTVTPLDLLRLKPLPFPDRVRLGLVMLYLQRFKNWPKLEPYRAKDWIIKYAGRNAYNVLWGPLLRAKFGANYDQVGMVWFWGKVYLRFASRGKGFQREVLGYPMGSFGEIIDTLGERIRAHGGEIFTSSPVNRIVVEDGAAVGLEVQSPAGGAEIRRFDQVIATTPSNVFARLAPNLPQSYVEKLQFVRYQAAVLVVLALDRSLSPIYWLTIGDSQIPFVAVIEQTNYVPPSLYGGYRVVYLSNYCGKENPHFHMPKDELFEAYLPHIKRINPQFDRSWVKEWWYHREEAAQPIITTNYSKYIPELKTPYRNLMLANTTQIYPEDRGTNYSIRLGRVVARMVDPSVQIRTIAAIKVGLPATEGLH